MNSGAAPVKKIKPYPIETEISKEGQAGLKRLILMVNLTGFIAKVEKDFYRVGEYYNCTFVVPVYNIKVTEPIRVMKTYDTMEQNPQGALDKIYMCEFHFVNPNQDTRKYIHNFMKSIGQKK
jgi:hypothetical protein